MGCGSKQVADNPILALLGVPLDCVCSANVILSASIHLHLREPSIARVCQVILPKDTLEPRHCLAIMAN